MKYNLYRHFDKDGRLLYVGISGNPWSRLKQHKIKANWFKKIKKVTIEIHKNINELKQAEIHAIINEKPIYNIAHNKTKNQKTSTGRCAVVIGTELMGKLDAIYKKSIFFNKSEFVRMLLNEALIAREAKK